MSDKPTSANELVNRARDLANAGKLADAKALLKQILAADPGNQRAQNGLRAIQARVSPKSNLPGVTTPNQQEIDQLLQLSKDGKLDEARQRAQALVQTHPKDAMLPNFLGVLAARAGQKNEAIKQFKQAIAINPDHVDARFNLGNVYTEQRRYDGAIRQYRATIRRTPHHIRAHIFLAQAYMATHRYFNAIETYKAVLELDPKSVESLSNLGVAHGRVGQPDTGLDWFDRALRVNPRFADALVGRGVALRGLGRTQDARTAFERALRVKPAMPRAHLGLTTVKTAETGDWQFEAIEKLLADEKTAPNQRLVLHFALGKLYDDLGEVDKAFANFQSGNALHHRILPYKVASDKALFDKLKDIFPVDQPMSAPPVSTGAVPIFVVGMPRSGTTVVERILSSHSDVQGLGELDALNVAILEASEGQVLTAEIVQSQGFTNRLRQSYMSMVEKYGVQGACFTDKTPLNFRWVGMICKAFPEAKIVHVTRDPVAVCWSNYRQYFGGTDNGFAYDLGDLGRYYNFYSDLMAHWNTAFPDRIVNVDYDALSADQDKLTRKLIADLGLEWQDACLEFHKNADPVMTASATQARRQMYQGSSERWKAYQTHLGKLAQTFGPAPGTSVH